MSTAIYTPCHSPASSREFLSFHTCLQDMHDTSFAHPLSPCQRVPATPPRMQPLLLTPSPLDRRTSDSFDFDSSMQLDLDDFSAATGVSTPFRRTKLAMPPPPMLNQTEDDLPPFFRPPDPPSEDDEGSFLRSNIGQTSLPLRTPERVSHDSIHVPCSVANVSFPHAPKRKINRLFSSNPRRHPTPLHIHHLSPDDKALKRFATLAPLPAPRFLHERNSAGNNMGRHVDILKEMRISERSPDVDTDTDSDEELSSLKVRRTTGRSVRHSESGMKDAVASHSSDHPLNKRRARSRPVSTELTGVQAVAPSPRPTSRTCHRRKGSNTSVSDAGSPRKMAKAFEQSRPACERRLASSATLFFGPAIVYPKENSRPRKDEGSLHASPSSPAKMDEELTAISPDSSFMNAFSKPGETSVQFSFTLASEARSPQSRIPTKFKKLHDSGVMLSDDETEEILQPVINRPQLSVLDSLRRSRTQAPSLPRSSVSAMTSAETTLFDDSFVTPSHERSRDSNRPVSLVDVSLVDEFIVKTLEAGTKNEAGNKRPPGTPQKRTKTALLSLPVERPWASVAVGKVDRTPLFEERLPAPDFGSVMDSGGSAGDLSVPKQVSTLDCKSRKSCPGNLGCPSATVASLHSNGSTTDDTETSPTDARLVNPRNRNYGDVGMGRPRAEFNASQYLLRRSSSGAFSVASDGSEGGNAGTPTRSSVSKKRDNDFRVPLLPFKQLSTPSHKPSRSTPLSPMATSVTNGQARGTGVRHSFRGLLSNADKRMKENVRPGSVGSVSHADSLKSGSHTGGLPLGKKKPRGTRESFSNACRPLGRFEREFVEVDKIGSGEFGSAIKVRFKHEDREGHVYAVKKSRRFEGNRHRSRLREEAEILQHLSARVGSEFHPNVLGYVDSWEQDDQLYILTELCEFGNFAHFLDEYGRHFQRLDEARVWKVFAEISSGLRFIHMANVVHFDLKPANIFITAAGRFKVGDFGMASFWPRSHPTDAVSRSETSGSDRNVDFEREGDKMYLAAEVLQGRYGKETDIFSFGMMMLETATNIYVPAQGDPWHRLREQDFSQVGAFTDCSSALQHLIMNMMSKDPAARPTAEAIYSHRVISRARARMEALLGDLHVQGESQPDILFKASPLAGVDDNFLQDLLGEAVHSDTMEMDCTT